MMRSEILRTSERVLASLVLVCTVPLTASGQRPGAERLEGTVLRQGAPVAGVPVSLHRVTPDASGVIASTRTDGAGEFRFTLPPPDTAGFTVFFATAEHQSVRYFGPPVHPGDAGAAYAVEVYDTAYSADGVRVSRRDLVLLPHADGGWEINEVLRLRNDGSRTLTPRSGMPVWEMRLPGGAAEFEAGAGEIASEEIRRMGDRVLLSAPFIPGDRELFLRYRVPPARGKAGLPMGSPVDTLNVFVQQPSRGLTVSGMRPTDVVTVEDRRFLQLVATDLAPDTTLQMAWEGAGPPIDPVLGGTGAAILLLTVGFGAALRRRPA